VSPVISQADIARPPENVFSYITDPARFNEWQAGVVSGHLDADGAPGVGAKCITTRLIRGSKWTVTSEITEFGPPNKWAMKGIDGPIRVDVTVTVDPREGGTQSHVTITADFHGHGTGKLYLPLVVRQARDEAPENCQKLKERLEAGA